MGKKTKFRDCPAAGRAITAAECGVGRHSVYQCPESCSFNLFSVSNYGQYLGLEHSADEKFFKWTLAHVPNPAQFESALPRFLEGDHPDSEYFDHLAWHAVYSKGPTGESSLEQWAKADFVGLNADERIIARARLRMRPVVLEAHRILDDRRVEAVDLLDPHREPLLVVDRGFAAGAVRFGIFSAHLIPLPHFHRPFGTAVSWPSLHPLETEEILYGLIQHLGGSAEPEQARKWLAEHFSRFNKALLAVSLARRQAMFDGMDAQFGKAVYELRQPFDSCRQQLDTVPEVRPEPLNDVDRSEGFAEARVWFAHESTGPEPGHEGATLGRILLGQSHWRLDVLGGERLAGLRRRFEQLMQDRVRFAGERRDDLLAKLRAREPKYDPALVPPALLREPPKIRVDVSRIAPPPEGVSPEDAAHQYRVRQDESFLDEPVPALEGKTPRQASSDPALRPKLLRLMKHWVHESDRETLETGRTHDVTWMLKELGLKEILFAPPPSRAPLLRASPDSRHQHDQQLAGALRNLAAPPPLPPAPWTLAEAQQLFDRAMDSFRSHDEALDYFAALDYPLFDDMLELSEALELGTENFDIVEPVLGVVVLCFAPLGTRPPELEYDALVAALQRSVEVAEDTELAEHGLTSWFDSCRQPALLRTGLAMLYEMNSELPRKEQRDTRFLFKSVVLLRTVIDELDRVLRQTR